MGSALGFIRRHNLTAYFVLAFGLTWTCVLLAPISLAFGFLGLFGPAAAAILMTAIESGWPGVANLLSRVVEWRAKPRWHLIAIGLPFALTAAAAGLWAILNQAPIFSLQPIGAVSLVLAVLVVSEEIGWRGYALPRLSARFGTANGSIILGVLWAAWHLANATIPGLERYWTAFPAFLLFVVAQTFLFTWLAAHTRGSILFAWLFHASINTAGALFLLPDQVQQWILSGIVFSVATLCARWLDPTEWRQSARDESGGYMPLIASKGVGKHRTQQIALSHQTLPKLVGHVEGSQYSRK